MVLVLQIVQVETVTISCIYISQPFSIPTKMKQLLYQLWLEEHIFRLSCWLHIDIVKYQLQVIKSSFWASKLSEQVQKGIILFRSADILQCTDAHNEIFDLLSRFLCILHDRNQCSNRKPEDYLMSLVNLVNVSLNLMSSLIRLVKKFKPEQRIWHHKAVIFNFI